VLGEAVAVMEAQATATVKEALAALYHHPDAAIRTAADRWLQEFQHTLDAWQVCARFSFRFALFLFVS
jgi:transportin-3